MDDECQFECPNCNTKDQYKFLAKHNGYRPVLWCVECDGLFSSRVLDRVYSLGRQHGLAVGERVERLRQQKLAVGESLGNGITRI